MARRSSPWRWALVAAIALAVAGTWLVAASRTEALRNAGLGVFVLAAVIYVASRVAVFLEDRNR